MPLTKKITLLLVAGSVLLALALLTWRFELARSQALTEQQRLLADAEQKLVQLSRDIQRYEAARGLLGSAGQVMARHEKIALGARFSAAELARINDVLNRAYQGDGFLLLKNFSLQWTSGNGAGDADASLRLDMTGEKVFLR